jgi:glutamine amidotransferase
LNYVVREAPYFEAHLIDEDVTIDFRTILSSGERAVVIATTPLTDNEQWVSMQAGSLWCFEDGNIIHFTDTVPSKVNSVTGNCG